MTVKDKSGFTLAEIAVAVAILGLALTTLVGLHTRMLNIYVSERNRITAAFYAQYLMTLVEVESEAPEAGTTKGDLTQVLDDAGYFETADTHEKQNKLAGWQYAREVTSVDLPLFVDALRKVELTITWGETTDDIYSLIYVVPNIDFSRQGAAASPQAGPGGTL
jgi:prepilin-type N-terminal cleavage/methylation domain-containing protein